MRYYFWAVMIALFTSSACESNKAKKVEVNPSCTTYPSSIDSLNLKELYDSARLAIYTWHCDLPYRPKNDSLRQMKFGELRLKFDKLTIMHDTVDLKFDFIDNDKIISPSAIIDFTELLTGIGYDIKIHKKLYMRSSNGFSMTSTESNSRYLNPFQVEVLAYIGQDWSKMDSCFKWLAESNGIRNK